MGLKILSIVVTVAKIVFVICGSVAIVQRIQRWRWRWRRAHPNAPTMPADQRALHKALLCSLASMMLCIITIGYAKLFTLTYMEANESDYIPGGVRFAAGIPALVLLLFAFGCWIDGLEGITDLLHQRTTLRKSPRAVICYVLEGLVVLFFLLIVVRIIIA